MTSPTHRRLPGAAVALSALLSALPAAAQLPPELARDRADFAAWLAEAPVSPLAAVAQQPVGGGIRLGPADADVPLAGVAEHRVTAERGVRLAGPGGARALPRGLAVRLGAYTLVAAGPPARAVLEVFGPTRKRLEPAYYEYRPAFAFEGPLSPPPRHGTVRVLGADGVEVEAAEAGSVEVRVGAELVRLRVLRMPSGGDEESDLQVFFRDGTNGHGSYPAGRFVDLIPTQAGRYRLDFNRARNPFCAYSTVYACPAPWPGNTFAAPVEAGERYAAALE